MKLLDPKNWYWFVGADRSRVYSSAAGDYVPVTDASYLAWAADGTPPTVIDTEANLGAVLAPYFPYVQRPVAATVLDNYQQAQSDDLATHKTYKILFNLLNRIQVLEGKAPLTVAQARAWVKSVM